MQNQRLFSPEEKYNNDPTFKKLVDVMIHVLKTTNISIEDFKDATDISIQLFMFGERTKEHERK